MRLGGVTAGETARGASAAIAATAIVLLLAGCGHGAARSTYTPTVTVAPAAAPATPSALPSNRITTPATPIGTRTPLPSAAATLGPTPADQCADAALRVTLSAVPSPTGSVDREIVFENIGSVSCVLRGAPAVAVVDDGTRLGKAAARDQQDATAVRIAPGASASALLQSVDIASDGSPLTGCTVVHGDGFRIVPPHSTVSVVVPDATAVACDPGPRFMTVHVVRATP